MPVPVFTAASQAPARVAHRLQNLAVACAYPAAVRRFAGLDRGCAGGRRPAGTPRPAWRSRMADAGLPGPHNRLSCDGTAHRWHTTAAAGASADGANTAETDELLSAGGIIREAAEGRGSSRESSSGSSSLGPKAALLVVLISLAVLCSTFLVRSRCYLCPDSDAKAGPAFISMLWHGGAVATGSVASYAVGCRQRSACNAC